MTLSTISKMHLDAALAHPRASSEIKGILNQVEPLILKRVPITAPADGSETDTTFTFPAQCVVLGVWLDISTAEATGGTKTLSVGTDSTDSGDADGFLAAVDCSSTGIVKGTLLSSGQTLGALLRVDESGAGVLVPEPSVACGSKLVTITAGSADWAEFAADICILYIDLSVA